MNRSELITLLQIERGLRIATCRILNGRAVREDGTDAYRTFTPDSTYGKPYHYKIPVGLTVIEGDLVVLPVRDGELVLGVVSEITAGIPDGLDLSGKAYPLRYIMDAVHPTFHDIAVAEEKVVEKQLQRAEVDQKLAAFQRTAGIDLATIALPSLDRNYAAPVPHADPVAEA
jgi:hypothetical protein